MLLVASDGDDRVSTRTANIDLTPAALKEQGVEASALRRKLEEYEAAVAAAREAALGAGRTVT